jgi:hypothetical protein
VARDDAHTRASKVENFRIGSPRDAHVGTQFFPLPYDEREARRY